MKLNVKALALAAGAFWGVGVFLITWWIMLFDGVTGEVTMLGRLYRGYSLTPMGSLIGLAWGFADGAVSGVIFGWLYNYICGRLEPRAS